MEVVSFWQPFLTAVSNFLLTPPVNGLFGILILSLIVGLFFEIIGVRRR